MNEKMYDYICGMIYGIGLATIASCFGFLPTEFETVIAAATYLGLGLGLYHYDEYFKEKLGVEKNNTGA